MRKIYIFICVLAVLNADLALEKDELEFLRYLEKRTQLELSFIGQLLDQSKRSPPERPGLSQIEKLLDLAKRGPPGPPGPSQVEKLLDLAKRGPPGPPGPLQAEKFLDLTERGPPGR